MVKRNQNYTKGQAAQAASMIDGLRRLLAVALLRKVCPECGGVLVREGNAFTCSSTPECEGVAGVSFRLTCAHVEARQR
jgi:ssDNA-binding Zn-finger/Zn-ribbon topoisomerase 1